VRTLYVAYFGAAKHLSESQVLPYLRELADAGLEVTLLTFEERSAEDRDEDHQHAAAMRDRLRASGIDWWWLRYHKSPSVLATAFDVAIGTLLAGYLILRQGIAVVHARSHVPGLMALALRALLGVKIVFDLRGLMAEEYVEAGVWRADGFLYRATKRVEARLFRKADAIVTLTTRAVEVLDERSASFRSRKARVEVIPCCVDLEKFRRRDRDRVRRELGLEGRTIMVYAGSLGGWYMTEELVRLFGVGCTSTPGLHFLVLTQSPHSLIRGLFEQAAVPEDLYTVRTVASDEMPSFLSSADLGVHLIRPGLSMVANSPTKFGEYLACGLPIMTNRGIGDVDRYVPSGRVGVIIEDLSAEGYRGAWTAMRALLQDEECPARCRALAERCFSLGGVGRRGYLRVYHGLGFEGR
jgi:glycosyltransferase involved in cell wall biosynthesis